MDNNSKDDLSAAQGVVWWCTGGALLYAVVMWAFGS